MTIGELIEILSADSIYKFDTLHILVDGDNYTIDSINLSVVAGGVVTYVEAAAS